ncbi:hypothetical protein Cni_G06446 [Canna indica]|uniref:Uncharacterized protein n=1 Tax=Canna indica TaxID=4628 RepID=A0AAQ3JYI8_9LILI|nr:hypothetical protein Cni_G06446 [Canna indica]
MEGFGEHKRRREEVDSQEISYPEAKRLLLDILDDDAEAGDQDLTSIMKSLEEEIALPSPLPPPSQPEPPVVEQPDLGYLFEASDDELGLPPPVALSSLSEEAAAAAAEGADAVEAVAFDRIWGFDDDINGYECFELGMRPEERGETEAEAEEGFVDDGGLFDSADVALCNPFDFADHLWRPETLPAV